jgi:DNA-directed RNA polymerase subunit RPC12/RpoP
MGSANRAPYAIGDDGHPDTTTVYVRCPHCMVLAVPLGLTYSPADAGGISPDHPIEATCGVCAADHDTTTEAIVPRDADRACARCGLTFAVPAAADEVVCPGCRLHQPGPATLADPQRAASFDDIRTARLPAVQARLRTLRQAADKKPTNDRPSYSEDPLVNRAAHRLTIYHDPDASARVGHPLEFGVCSCGEWVTPSWDTSAIFEAYDQHMTEIQTTAHEQARNAGRRP